MKHSFFKKVIELVFFEQKQVLVIDKIKITFQGKPEIICEQVGSQQREISRGQYEGFQEGGSMQGPEVNSLRRKDWVVQ